jgi:hypothetical protein
MDKQFDNVLSGIRNLMTLVIQSIRNKGLAYDDAITAEFWQNVRKEISTSKRTTALAKQQMPKEEFKKFIFKTLHELFVIMDVRRPDFVKEGWYESPNKPTDPLYFWAYQDLNLFSEWVQVTYLREPDDVTVLPPTYLELVQHDFVDLYEFIEELRHVGISKGLIDTLMAPFKYLLPRDVVTLEHRDLVKLWKLKAAIMECRELRGEQLADALYHLLFALNINLLDSVHHCKGHIQRLLDEEDTVSGKLMVLARCELSIREITVVDSQLRFNPYSEQPLSEILLKVIAARYDFYTKTESIASFAKAEALPVTITEPIQIALTNQQYALHMRVLAENGFFQGIQADVIRVTGRMVLTGKNQHLGAPTHAQNFKTPGPKAIADTYDMFIGYVVWMHDTWGDTYGLTDLTSLSDQEVKKYISALKTRSGR